MAKQIRNLASEIDARIARSSARGKRGAVPHPPSNRDWRAEPAADNPDPSFDFGVLSLGEYGDETALSGDVKLSEAAGIEIARIDADNALSVGFTAEAAEMLGLLASAGPGKLTTNNIGAPLITVFRLGTQIYALTAGQIYRVGETTGTLVAIPGCAPGPGEQFTCARVFSPYAFIGTSTNNRPFLNIYRFDGSVIAGEPVLPAIGQNYFVAGMTVCAASLYALAGDLAAPNYGWTVLQRAAPGAWVQLLPWQSGEQAGTIGASSELLVTANAGAAGRVYSVQLGAGQAAPMPVVNLPGGAPLATLAGAEIAVRGCEAYVSDGSNIWGIADTQPKTHSAAPVNLAAFFAAPSRFTAPASYIAVDSTGTAFGIEAGGLFVFGVEVRFRIDATPTFEDWCYLLGYDGAELIEIAAGKSPPAPYFRPVEVDRGGRILFAALTAADAPYVWKMRMSLKHILGFAGRKLGVK
ncbi:MAG: hypothetical protein HRF49_01455 [bacterium]|jgi:hypothetical protein